MFFRIRNAVQNRLGGSAGGTVGQRIINAGIVVAFAHVCLKLISPLQYILVGQLCDEVTRDLFVFGFQGLLWMLFLIGEEALGPPFLPVFTQEQREKGEGEAWTFANTILSVQFMLIAAAVCFLAFFPELVVAVITKWDEPGANPVYMRLAPRYVQYMVFGLFGLSLGSTTYMLLNGYKRFFLAAFGDALFKLAVVAALVIAWVYQFPVTAQNGVLVFGAAAIIGSLLKLAVHLFGLRDKIRNLRPQFQMRKPSTRQFGVLVAPLIIGIVFAKFRDTYNNMLVLSMLEEGVMSAAAFGRKIYQTLSFLGPYAVSIAMLPFFCEMVTRRDKGEFGRMVTQSSRLVLLMCVPLAAVFIALSMPVSQVLFQGGEYSFESAQQAAVANACYTLVLPFAALECIFMQTYFANRRMVLVTVLGIAYSSLSVILSYLFVVRLEWEGLAAVAAVSLAFTVSRIGKTITLGAVLRGMLPCFPARETFSYLVRMFVMFGCTAGSAYGVHLLYTRFIPSPQVAKRLVVLPRVGPDLVISGLVSGLVCLGVAWLLCREELLLVLYWLKNKLSGGDGGSEGE